MLLAFGTALGKSSHAGFAAGEVGLAATALDDLVELLTHSEPTFLFIVLCLCNVALFNHIVLI